MVNGRGEALNLTTMNMSLDSRTLRFVRAEAFIRGERVMNSLFQKKDEMEVHGQHANMNRMTSYRAVEVGTPSTLTYSLDEMHFDTSYQNTNGKGVQPPKAKVNRLQTELLVQWYRRKQKH